MKEFDDESYPEWSRVTPQFEGQGDCSEFVQDEQEQSAPAQTAAQPPDPAQQRMIVAEHFFWRWVASESAECAIEAIAELISYGGDLDEIMRKLAL